MTNLSPNTQAILLLTAPLLVGSSATHHPFLTPNEYKTLAKHLQTIQQSPAALLSMTSEELQKACPPSLDVARLQRLLERGFLLSQAVEQWRTRAIWVLSRADADYPRPLKTHLRENAPALLYGCGDIRLLHSGGLAVVGSRNADDHLLAYARSIGQLAAQAGKNIISGGARGIDLAAMNGALEAGGNVCGVLSDSLDKAAIQRSFREYFLHGQLVMLSPFDPSARFQVGNAMQRNKYIYALADLSLVVNAEQHKGGTWAGASEQLEKLRFVPVYVRTQNPRSSALEALLQKGAMPWPEPSAPEDMARLCQKQPPPLQAYTLSEPAPKNDALSEFLKPITPDPPKPTNTTDTKQTTDSPQPPPSTTFPLASPSGPHRQPFLWQAPPTPPVIVEPKEALFHTVRVLITHQLSKSPMDDKELAATLDVSEKQTKAWLERLIEEGCVVKKSSRPLRYALRPAATEPTTQNA